MEEKREDIKVNAKKFIEQHFKIIDKDRNTIPLVFNDAQELLYNKIRERKSKGLPSWFLILKARQVGMSTFTEALGTEQILTKPNSSMVIIAHEEKASNQLYRMTHNFYTNLPDWFKNMVGVVKDNQSLMQFTNDSTCQVMVASANSSGTGRGQTITYAHLSEFDWWKGDAMGTLNGVLSACTNDSIIIIETTAHGCGNFKSLWDKAVEDNLSGNEDGFIPMFFAWWQDKSYSKYYDGFELTDEEEELKKEFNLTNEQISWRRWTIKTKCGGSINLFHQEFPSTPEEAFVSSGECIFDLNALYKRKTELLKNGCSFYDKGYYLYDFDFDDISKERKLKDIRWVSDIKNGYITKYKKVESRHPYTIAIDPSGDGSDFTAMQVLDNRTCEQVAVFHKCKLSSLDISSQAYCLAMEYNIGLLASEINFDGSVETMLSEFGYENLYLLESDSTRLDKRIEKRVGFRTTTVTRPILISMLVDFVNNNTHLINDYATLVEAENFVRVIKLIDGTTREKSQANVGKHDDLLMSLGIALYMRDSGQAQMELYEEDVKPRESTWFDKVFELSDTTIYEEEEGIIYD